MEQIMTILKNDRRISQMEYERNYIAIYDAIKQTISKVPSRHWYFLASPIIEKMNKTYDDVLELSEMHFAKVPKKTRMRKCQEILFGIKDLNQYVYTYWVISDGTNKIRSVPYKHRIALAQMVNKEVLYIIGVMRKKEAASYGLTFNPKKTVIVKMTKGFTFLKIHYRLAQNGKVIRTLSHSSVVRMRRKLKKFKAKVDTGQMTVEDVYNSVQSWVSHAKYAKQSYHSVKSILLLYDELFGG